MWQEIAIIIVGLLVILYVGFKFYNLFTKSKYPSDPCAGCTGCTLKEQLKNKKSPRT
ncbi:MAG: FeoB-associated Cys-rich membrane protein [Parabacteroides sp.]|nr:FeoB-associated Cys-rich membrane protein [Parabacteroides sp.]MBR2496885.1 FeoB-associated Cys-rich membrane protein [Parabacteroides sp.]